MLQVTEDGQGLITGSRAMYYAMKDVFGQWMDSPNKTAAQMTPYTPVDVESIKNAIDYTKAKIERKKVQRIIELENAMMEMIRIDTASHGPIPALYFYPKNTKPSKAVLLICEKGKNSITIDQLETFLSHEIAVMTVDIPGTGELGFEDPFERNTVFFSLMQAGTPLIGFQAALIEAAASYLVSHANVPPSRLVGISIGTTGPALLHAAAVGADFGGLVLVRSQVSWRSILFTENYDLNFGLTIYPKASINYDLPDLLLQIPSRVLFVGPILADGAMLAAPGQNALFGGPQFFDTAKRLTFLLNLNSIGNDDRVWQWFSDLEKGSRPVDQ
jgi:hypothetical protein